MLSPTHQLLKEATQAVHAEVEALSHAKDIMAHRLTPVGYGSLISTNYHFLDVVNRAVTAFRKNVADEIPPGQASVLSHADGLSSRIEALERDLAASGGPSSPPPTSTVDEIPHLTIHTPAQAFGTMYVVEGSMLGGAVIHRALQKTVQLSQYRPFHFYGQFNAEVGARWRRFCSELAANITTPDEQQQATTKAIETFELFKFILGQHAAV